MFERYTTNARKAVFCARYEAGQFGSDSIETEHLLLGILASDFDLKLPIPDRTAKRESVRQQVAARNPDRKPSLVSVDLPLSAESRRVLEYASEEARAVKQDSVDIEHLLLGILRVNQSFAAGLLEGIGVTIAMVRGSMSRPKAAEPSTAGPLPAGVRDLTREARNGRLDPLIGRERELERAIQILSRREHKSVVLVGEPGVGKTAIVEAVAQRIAEGNVPPDLMDVVVLAIEAGVPEKLERPDAILYVEGLFDQAAAGNRRSDLPPALRLIATATPAVYRQTVERAPTLARQFEAVTVLAPGEEEAAMVLRARKEQYELFHGVAISEEAIGAAIRASGVFLRHRQLPDRALDLIDEAGARLKLVRESEPREIVELRRRIRREVREMENAIATHKFDEARKHAEAEQADRENLMRLLEERKARGISNVLTAADIEEVIADRTGAPAAAVKAVLAQAGAGEFERTAKELGAQIPTEMREWVPFLAAWVANCSPEDADKLAYAIRWLKSRPAPPPSSQS